MFVIFKQVAVLLLFALVGCILAKKNESVTIFRIVKIIDPNAFVSQSSVIGVYGEGFDEMKVKIKDKDIKTIKS